MAAAGKENNFQSDLLKGAGHLIDIPFAPVTNKDYNALIPMPAKLHYGGDDFELHSVAQERAWRQTLAFYREHLF